MKIKPLQNRILLEPYEQKTKGKAKIVLPETAEKEKSQLAKVLVLGEGKNVKKLNLKKGNLVFIEKFGPSEIELDGKTYLLAEPDQILALIE